MTPRPRKPWSKVIEEMGISVRVFERDAGSLLYREVRVDGRKDRKSLGHRDRGLAEQQARELAKRLAEFRLTGHVGPIALGHLTRLYLHHRATLLSAKRQQDGKAYAKLLVEFFGDGFSLDDLSQTHIDRYVKARRTGTLQPKRKGGIQTAGVRAATVGNDLRWLSACCNWARSFKVNGRRLMAENPLRDLQLPTEQNPRRPVASEERYRKTLAKCDEVEPTGRLRLILTLARFTGRRENAILHLRASDILLTRDQVLRALGATGQDERLADHMPHGAIYWRPDADKRAYEDVAPIGAVVRGALEAYLRVHPRVGDLLLLDSTRYAGRRIDKSVAGWWLMEAERRAGLPKLERGRFHPYRRLAAVESKHQPDIDVAKAFGWRDLRTMKRAYQQPDGATVLKVVESVGSGPTSDTPPKASDGSATG